MKEWRRHPWGGRGDGVHGEGETTTSMGRERWRRLIGGGMWWSSVREGREVECPNNTQTTPHIKRVLFSIPLFTLSSVHSLCPVRTKRFPNAFLPFKNKEEKIFKSLKNLFNICTCLFQKMCSLSQRHSLEQWHHYGEWKNYTIFMGRGS